jgi:predicted nucleic acid-binding Zn ribbon protein
LNYTEKYEEEKRQEYRKAAKLRRNRDKIPNYELFEKYSRTGSNYNLHPPPKGLKHSQCLHCGEVFRVLYPRQWYCSDRCAVESERYMTRERVRRWRQAHPSERDRIASLKEEIRRLRFLAK